MFHLSQWDTSFVAIAFVLIINTGREAHLNKQEHASDSRSNTTYSGLEHKAEGLKQGLSDFPPDLPCSFPASRCLVCRAFSMKCRLFGFNMWVASIHHSSSDFTATCLGWRAFLIGECVLLRTKRLWPVEGVEMRELRIYF